MSFDAKLAALAIVMLLALAIYGVMSSVVVSGSGGLGAGSAGYILLRKVRTGAATPPIRFRAF